MKARAAIFTGLNEPLVIDEIDVDGPKAGEVLVKLEATGLCHTEIWYMEGGDTQTLAPAILGHEGGGVVQEVGPGVTTLQPGDHVVPLYIAECGECEDCTSGKTNLCSALDDTYMDGVMPDGTTRLRWNGQDLRHFMGTSTFAEYTVVPEVALAKVRKDAPLDRVCLFGCGIPTGVGAVLYTAKVQPGDTVAVFGCGPIGLNVVQGAKIAGAGMIIAVDLQEARLESAKLFGATHTVNALELGGSGTDAVKELTGGGVDFAFEATGVPAVMRQAFESTRYGWGKCVLIGVAKTGLDVSITPRMLIAGRSLTGTAFGGTKGRTQVPQMVDWYMDGKLKVDELITRFISLEDVNDAFAEMHENRAFRFVVRY